MVSAVCQSMGCWMQITDTSGKAHIKMAGHSFFVPKESSGHRAMVQGKVLTGNQPNACGADGCGNKIDSCGMCAASQLCLQGKCVGVN